MVKELSTFFQANKPRYRPRRAFFALCLLTTVIFYITTTNTASATTYYVSAADGNDSNPGTSSAPWKTIAKAQSVVTSGDTVKLRTGNYGAYSESPAINRTDWVTYTADTGSVPVFTKIYIYKSISPGVNSYLKFDGIDIQHPAYTPIDDGYWHTKTPYSGSTDANGLGYLVETQFANYLQFLNGNYQGYNKYLSNGVHCLYGSNIIIQNCEVAKIADGIYVDGGSTWGYNVTIKHNYVHDMCLGSGIRVEAIVGTNTLIEDNHVANQSKDVYDAYYPYEEPSANVHIGSGLSIKNHDTTIRGNIVHGGFAEGMNWYSGQTYHNMTVENNLFYDTGTINMVHIDGAATIRNNTSIGWIVDERVSNIAYIIGRYGTNALNVGLEAGFDGTGVEVYNNICIASYNLPSPTDANLLFTENYNIFWKESSTGSGVKGANSKKIVWLTSPTTGLHGFYDYFEDIGYETNTSEYTHISPPQAFFVDPNYYTNQTPTENGPNKGGYQTWDYHLAPGSPGINFGDANNQPSDSLGSLGADGFIIANGPARDASHHSVGCYEYVSGSQSYSLTITAANGTVTKSPDSTSYSSGETVTLQATPNTGYHFVNWSGDATDTNSSVAITMNSNKSATANFAINTYTLNVTATNGSVSKTLDKSSYNYGDTVTLGATANTGYHFSSWSGDASGTSSSTTITMNANKTVIANFAINTYTLNVTATNGSVSKMLDKNSYNYGESVTLAATANTGYHFSNWSGDASGINSTTTVTMTSNKSVTANFAINTYTLDITAVFGSVTKSPNKTLYNYGETVSLTAVPNSGHVFTGWTGDASGSSNPVSLTMNSNKSVTANFVYTLVDTNAPSIAKSRCYPLPNAIQVSLDTIIAIHIVDEGRGIDANTVSIEVNSNIIYKGTGNVSSYDSLYGQCHRVGNIAEYTYIYQPNQNFDFDQSVTVAASAADLAGNQGSDSYSFKTEMISFGKNQKVNSGSDSLANGHPATLRDSSGNIWAVWHKGNVGSRDIYSGKLKAGNETFETSTQLTTDASDQCNPAIAKDSTGKLYVVWQDNRRGNWDIYLSTSVDGNSWSTATRITDSNNANQVNPAIAIDRSSPNKVYVAWQDDRNSNQDIYVATSTDLFLTKTITQVNFR